MYHKVIRHFFLFQCFILSSSFAVNPHADIIQKPSGSVQEEKQKNTNSNQETGDFFGSGKFQSNRLYAQGGAIYGYISDGGTSGVSVVETFNRKGDYVNEIFRPDPNYGFSVQLGYKFDEEGTKNIYADFIMLRNYKNFYRYVGKNSFLINDITQLGNFEYSGFNVFAGPAEANDFVSLEYMGASIALRRPWDEPNFKVFSFSKIVGLKYVRIEKNFRGTITGDVYTNDPVPLGTPTPGQDYITYNAELNAIGPIVGVAGAFLLTDKIHLKGYGLGSLMAGLSQSEIVENGYSDQEIVIGLSPATQKSTSFLSRQNHKPEAWTPAFFEIGCSISYNILPDSKLSIEGGITASYILPTLSNGSYTQAVGGTGLVRLNDNLNMSMTFLKLNANIA
jgi:hypothetical protein